VYPNLRAEMKRKGITQRDLVNVLKDRDSKICLTTLCNKMTGKSGFTFAEVVAIKDILGTDIPLEVLFQKEAV